MAASDDSLKIAAMMLDTWNLRYHLNSGQVPDLNNLQMRILTTANVIRHLEVMYHLPQTGNIHSMFTNYKARKNYGSIWKWVQTHQYDNTTYPIYERIFNMGTCFESDLEWITQQNDKISYYATFIVRLTLGQEVDVNEVFESMDKDFEDSDTISIGDFDLLINHLLSIIHVASLRRGDLTFIDQHQDRIPIKFTAQDFSQAFGSGNYDFVMAIGQRVTEDRFGNEMLDMYLSHMMSTPTYDHRLFILLVEYGFNKWLNAYWMFTNNADEVLATFCVSKLGDYIDPYVFVELTTMGYSIIMDKLDEHVVNDVYRDADRLIVRKGYIPEVRQAVYEYE